MYVTYLLEGVERGRVGDVDAIEGVGRRLAPAVQHHHGNRPALGQPRVRRQLPRLPLRCRPRRHAMRSPTAWLSVCLVCLPEPHVVRQSENGAELCRVLEAACSSSSGFIGGRGPASLLWKALGANRGVSPGGVHCTGVTIERALILFFVRLLSVLL